MVMFILPFFLSLPLPPFFSRDSTLLSFTFLFLCKSFSQSYQVFFFFFVQRRVLHYFAGYTITLLVSYFPHSYCMIHLSILLNMISIVLFIQSTLYSISFSFI